MEAPLPPWPRATSAMSAEEVFSGTWARSGLPAEKQAEVWQLISDAYTSEQRHYHNLDHIVESLAFIGLYIKSGAELEDRTAVEFSLWFHDIIHVPGSPDNEPLSAQLAQRVLRGAGLSEDSLHRVHDLILATATHLHPPEPDARVVVDADLSVLGAAMGRYVQYAIGVRREYGHLSDEAYSAGRSKFLRRLLEREQLYATDTAKSLFEQQARANLAHELQLTAAGLTLASPIEDELPAVEENPEEEAEANVSP